MTHEVFNQSTPLTDVNLFTGKYHDFRKGTKSGEYDEKEIPPEMEEKFKQYTDQLTEAVAATDDALIERYLSGDTIPREEIVSVMKRAMFSCNAPASPGGMTTLAMPPKPVVTP